MEKNFENYYFREIALYGESMQKLIQMRIFLFGLRGVKTNFLHILLNFFIAWN